MALTCISAGEEAGGTAGRAGDDDFGDTGAADVGAADVEFADTGTAPAGVAPGVEAAGVAIDVGVVITGLVGIGGGRMAPFGGPY